MDRIPKGLEKFEYLKLQLLSEKLKEDEWLLNPNRFAVLLDKALERLKYLEEKEELSKCMEDDLK